MSLTNRLTSIWKAYGNDKNAPSGRTVEYSYANHDYQPRLSSKGTITPIINRIAMDVASVDIRHVEIDENGRYLKDIHSGLNNCLTVSANIDQSSIAFRHELVYNMLDDGVVAVIPAEAEYTIRDGERVIQDVYSMRTAQIMGWEAKKVHLRAYNEETGEREELWMDKSKVLIVENPLKSVMNDGNSVMQQLLRKQQMLDKIDAQVSSGRLDLIVQLPYTVKTTTRRSQAETRRKDLETQLVNSKYGVAYLDGTEKITQLNRPVENTLQAQIDSLTKQLYDQLFMTPEIMNGSATEEAMSNYFSRLIDYILTVIVLEFRRKFLTDESLKYNFKDSNNPETSHYESVMFFQNKFALVPPTKMAEIADSYTRNQILSSNEVRQLIGFAPSDQPDADTLQNKNLNPSEFQNQGQPIEDGAPLINETEQMMEES